MKITKYKQVNKGSIIAQFSLLVEKWGDFYINDMLLISNKNGGKFISFPTRTYEQDGQKQYFPYCGFADKETKAAFQEKVMEALHAYAKTQDDHAKFQEESR